MEQGRAAARASGASQPADYSVTSLFEANWAYDKEGIIGEVGTHSYHDNDSDLIAM